MNNLINKTREMSAKVNNINEEGVKEYLIISDFGESSVVSEPGFLESYFRIFTPVKSIKGRKLNSLYGDNFNPFKDTLMDYPTVVQYKLGKVGSVDWSCFNRLISLHISRCPLNCWHCYLDECLKADCGDCAVQDICDRKMKTNHGIKEGWSTAKVIVDGFLRQRESDRKRDHHSNILRITGGEPFLVPELIIEILEELESRNLHKEVFLWTETNLLPFINSNDNETIVKEEHLNKLTKHNNFCVHPCFHGLTANNFEEITGQKLEDWNLLFAAFKRLIDAKIDVYPSFGSNMSSSEDVENFYIRTSEINDFLPLRFCLIEYDLDYEPVKRRRDEITGFAKDHEKVYDRFQVIEKWNKLLIENTGYKYGDIPRHLVPIKRG